MAAASQAASQAFQVASQAATQAASDGWLGAPWTFWSALVASSVTAVVAIVTLVISSRHNLKRQADQLRHDAAEKREDRKLSIRREVYLAVVEQAHAFLAAIGGLPQRGVDTSNDGDALQAFLKANAKVWLVADAEAAHLSRDLASQLSEFFLRAVAASMPARYALEPVRVQEKQLEREDTEYARLCAQFNDAKAKKDSSEEQARLSSLLSESSSLRTDLRRAQQAARAAAAPIAFEAFRSTFGEMRAVQRSLCALVSALRAELNLPRDDAEFLDQLRDMEQRAWAAMNQIVGNDPSLPMPEILAAT